MNPVGVPESVRLACVIGACWLLSVAAAAPPPDVTATALSDAARTAADQFWSALHGANYAAYPKALAAVEAALAEAPDDPLQNAHLGWLRIWHLSEAERFDGSRTDFVEDLSSARHHFGRAVELDPHEARYVGFYATTLTVDAARTGDEQQRRQADAMLERAVRMWPEFNLFTAAYIHSSEPYDSPQYATAMQRMWRNVDLCMGKRVSRDRPALAQYVRIETTVGAKRACWNSQIAPHNFEGFFLNFGDMLVKEGRIAAAREMYANARLSATYGTWAYHDILERRIGDADRNVAMFRDSTRSDKNAARMMIQSNFSCMGCHRQ